MIFPLWFGTLVLGRAFDYTIVNTTATSIFADKTVAENTITAEVPCTRAEYSLIDTSSDVGKMLDVSGELMLKVKKGDIGLEGKGEYMHNNYDRSKVVEVLMVVEHQTVIKTIPSYLTPTTGWQDKEDQSGIGTHYVRSIIYGGTLIISYQMIAKSTDDALKIKASMEGKLDISGSLNIGLNGTLDKIDKDIQSYRKLDIKAFSTTGPVQQVTTLDEVFNLIKAYPKHVEEKNGGIGLPMKVEVLPLSTLSKNYKGALKFISLGDLVNVAVDKYDDIRFAWKAFQDFNRIKEGLDIPPEIGDQFDDFDARCNKALKAMTDAISSLDLLESDINHFDEAFKKYGEGDKNIPFRYTKEVERLINLALNTHTKWYPYTRGVTRYTHWGNVNCSLPSPDPLVVGVAASSPAGYEKSPGNGANLQCLRLEPSLDTVIHKPDHPLKRSAINGLTFMNLDGKKIPLFCAHCQLENATSTVTVIAKKQCPEGMKLEYDGFLATGFNGITEPICIDNYSIDSYEDADVNEEDEAANVLKPLWIDSKDEYEEPERYIPCVVCSR